jgi:hypothetical protein
MDDTHIKIFQASKVGGLSGKAGDLIVPLHQLFHKVTSNKTRGSGNQDFHHMRVFLYIKKLSSQV